MRILSAERPRRGHHLTVHVMPDDGEGVLDKLLHRLLLTSGQLLGLDCEWQPQGRGGKQWPMVSVLQLSTETDCIIIRPAGAVSGTMHIPDCIRTVLEDPRVVKAGVGVAEDVRRLGYCGIRVKVSQAIRPVIADHATITPFALLASAPGPLSSSGRLGAAGCNAETGSRSPASRRWAAQSVLGVHHDKALQRSDWGLQSLSRAQLEYAAKDAFLSRQIAAALLAEVNGKEGRAAATAPDVFAPFLDRLNAPSTSMNFKSGPEASGTSYGGAGEGDVYSALKTIVRGARGKQLRPDSIPTRKAVLYENCRLLVRGEGGGGPLSIADSPLPTAQA